MVGKYNNRNRFSGTARSGSPKKEKSNGRPRFFSPKLSAVENKRVSDMLYRSWQNGRKSGIKAGYRAALNRR